MGRVITKLNLNKTPQLVENNSLIFAKNIKLLKDGSIGPDFAVRNIMSLITSTNKYGVIGHIVGVNNKIYFFVESYDKSIEQDEHIEINFPPTTGDEVRNVVFILGSFKFNYDILEGKTYQEFVISKIKDVLNIDATITLDAESNKYILNIKHNLSENLEVFWNYKQDTLYGIKSFTLQGTGLPTKIQILEYNELTDFIQEIQCGWKYNGGKITGNVTVNNTNEEILTICEYDCPTADIPIKHINLARCKADDDESIYTQAPNVPLTNLKLITTYTKTIALTNLRTTVSGSGATTSGKSGITGQGKWGSYKLHTGHATIPSSILNTLKAGNCTINNAYLIVTRQNTSHGYTGEVPYPVIDLGGARQSASGYKIAQGSTKTIPLNNDIKSALKSGASDLRFVGEGYSQYMFCSSVKLKVNYTITG